VRLAWAILEAKVNFIKWFLISPLTSFKIGSINHARLKTILGWTYDLSQYSADKYVHVFALAEKLSFLDVYPYGLLFDRWFPVSNPVGGKWGVVIDNLAVNSIGKCSVDHGRRCSGRLLAGDRRDRHEFSPEGYTARSG